jgi:hypothetical protein
MEGAIDGVIEALVMEDRIQKLKSLK